MILTNTIQVYEYGELRVGSFYGEVKKVEFKKTHFHALSKYLTENNQSGYYELLNLRIRFKNYVGVIKVGDLTIEVLPKCDRYDTEQDKITWQSVLIDMLTISLQVEAKTTTNADIHIRQHSVLDTYLNIFLNETSALIHQGLVKKYRTNESNQTVLKGKLQIHKHITTNIVHAERFYVSHQVYDRDNVYNSILYQALQCIRVISSSMSLVRRCESLLLNFPECGPLNIKEKLFDRLSFDRKTERYKTAITLAKIILMNYHPDVKGGKNDILAIMFDMNLLWENYIYYVIKLTGGKNVRRQLNKQFWQGNNKNNVSLIPDIVIENKNMNIVLDTKWKYQQAVSVQDLRQMFSYGKYFKADQSFLVYPYKTIASEPVRKEDGNFYDPDESGSISAQSCGLMFVDLLSDRRLNKEIGSEILSKLGLL